tara:strand:+ start:1155 stop:1388 length:234 start_codon:yes stop_codon:yes gene_type:complete
MKATFFNKNEHIIISKKQTENFEYLIGNINEVLEENFNIRIYYDQNDPFFDIKKKKNEDCFSGFAILKTKSEEVNNE